MNTSTNAFTVTAGILLAALLIVTLPADVILIGGTIVYFLLPD